MNKFVHVSLSLLLTISALAPQPSYAKSSCQSTINSVVNDMKKKGVRNIFVDKEKSKGRLGNPTKRDHILYFTLSPWQKNYADINSKTPKIDKSSKAIEQILDSKALMKTYSDKIVSNCSDIAFISFAFAQSDAIREYVIQSNGKTRYLVSDPP